MKTFKSPTQARLRLVMLAGASVLFFSACVKTDNRDLYNPAVGYMNVVQASPDEPALNFYLNNNLATNPPLNFGDYTLYFQAYTGMQNAVFSNASTAAQVVSQGVTIKQNQYYSLFLTNTTASPQYLYLTDTLNKPATGQAGIRFINLSPDAGAVDFSAVSGKTTVGNEGFQGYSGFIGLAGGTYSLQVMQTGTNTVLASLSGVTLLNGGLYTIWLQGLKAGTTSTDKLTINSMQNAQF